MRQLHLTPLVKTWLYVGIGYVLFFLSILIPIKDIDIATIFYTPGFLFGLAIGLTTRGKGWRKLLFVIGSGGIYTAAVYVALWNGYFGPNYLSLLMASVGGALVETLFFCFIFQASHDLSYRAIGILLVVALVSFVWDWKVKYTLYAILPWQLGVAYVLTQIRKHQDTSNRIISVENRL